MNGPFFVGVLNGKGAGIMANIYDAKWVEQYYDECGEKEWDRLTGDPEGEVKLYIHRHYMKKYINAGDRVLEIGPGPGRFTQVLAELGAKVVLADISSEQLKLNRQKASELGFGHAVEEHIQLDVCDMSVLADDAFDAVVCYGGPLSYVFERVNDALAEIKRVLKPTGKALLSVMSLWGAMHRSLEGVLALPQKVNRRIVATGDVCPLTYPESKHNCHMFRAKELQGLLKRHDFMVLDMSASNCVSTVWDNRLGEVRKDAARWEHLLRLELEACSQPGCLDMGTHMLAIVQKAEREN